MIQEYRHPGFQAVFILAHQHGLENGAPTVQPIPPSPSSGLGVARASPSLGRATALRVAERLKHLPEAGRADGRACRDLEGMGMMGRGSPNHVEMNVFE